MGDFRNECKPRKPDLSENICTVVYCIFHSRLSIKTQIPVTWTPKYAVIKYQTVYKFIHSTYKNKTPEGYDQCQQNQFKTNLIYEAGQNKANCCPSFLNTGPPFAAVDLTINCLDLLPRLHLGCLFTVT